MPRFKTRKHQRGGQTFTNTNKNRIRKAIGKKEQVIHCLSQLKRFSECFQKGDTSRLLQFGYNLGRLQELCGETSYPEIWWKPIETAIIEKNWDKLDSQIKEIQEVLSIEFDEATLKKGC